MRTLAIDHGTVRIGIAISDELGIIAQPLDFIPAGPFAGFVSRLQAILAEKPCALILVGMPRSLNGTYGPAAGKVREFIEQLRKETGIPIRTWDERLTSAQANRVMIEGGVRRERRKQKVDSMAAAILLQSYLDSQSA